MSIVVFDDINKIIVVIEILDVKYLIKFFGIGMKSV